MYYTVLQSTGKKQLIEEALTQAAGRPHLRLSLQGDQPAAPSRRQENPLKYTKPSAGKT